MEDIDENLQMSFQSDRHGQNSMDQDENKIEAPTIQTDRLA